MPWKKVKGDARCKRGEVAVVQVHDNRLMGCHLNDASANSQIAFLNINVKGSGRSGNWGHAGRPGKRGGSSPASTGGAGFVRFDVPPAIRVDGLPPDARAFHDAYGDTWDAWTDVGAGEGFENYTRGDSEIINGGLRKAEGGEDVDRFVSQTDLDTINELDRNIEVAEAPQDFVAYRGGRVPADAQPGDTFTDHGYVSTSLSKNTADGFMAEMGGSNDRGDPKVLEIRVPEGHPAAYLDGEFSNWPDEYEVLLPRGMTFSIAAIQGDTVIVDIVEV